MLSKLQLLARDRKHSLDLSLCFPIGSLSKCLDKLLFLLCFLSVNKISLLFHRGAVRFFLSVFDFAEARTFHMSDDSYTHHFFVSGT